VVNLGLGLGLVARVKVTVRVRVSKLGGELLHQRHLSLKKRRACGATKPTYINESNSLF